jgi:peptide chain release factor 3
MTVHCNHTDFFIHRWLCLQDEYGVDTTLEPLSFSVARWVLGGWPAVERAGRMFNTTVVKDAFGRPVLLFR